MLRPVSPLKDSCHGTRHSSLTSSLTTRFTCNCHTLPPPPQKKKKKVVRVLLQSGVPQTDSMRGATPLWTAVDYNRPVIASLLIAHGGDVNARMRHTGDTALHRAIATYVRVCVCVWCTCICVSMSVSV